jgi:hypothetical protein
MIRMYEQLTPGRIRSSGMLRSLELVRTDVSENIIAYIIKVTRIAEIGSTLVVTNT